jgi:glycosyltransferase involved in cell wall biosynthesis
MEIKGIKYIAPMFDNCYDDQTELLTDSGWKFFKDLSGNELICTLNDRHVIEYNPIDEIIINDYDGVMYHFYSNMACVDLMVTPNHNMYIQTEYGRRKKDINTWRFDKAENIFGRSCYFKKNGSYKKEGPEFLRICNRDIKTSDWLEFLGYYLSEGSATITSAPNHYIIQIRQFGDNLYKMANALQKVTPNRINVRHEDGRVIVNDKELCVYLKKEFGNKYEKRIPRYILNECSKEQLVVLFKALMLGDGHDLHKNYKEGKISGGSSYNTSSIQLRDDFMELLLKIGYSGSYIKVYSKGDEVSVYDRMYLAKADNWTVRIKFENNVCFKNKDRKFKEEIIDYKGTIHCVTVKNHTLYIRRNGMPVWSGNSGYAQASRGNILALHEKGIPLTLKPISFESIHPDLGEDGKVLKSLVNQRIDYNVVIIHTTPEFWRERKEKGKVNVGYTIWETSLLHPEWKNYINQNVQKVLVGCEWNVEVFKNSGVEIPIGVVPHGINMERFDNPAPYNIVGINKDTFVFYSIFQFTERKNPLSMIKAYWHAFQNDENVALVLKTYRGDYSEVEKQGIRDTIKKLKDVTPMDKYPKILLIPNMLTDEEIYGLHTRGDCYVSLDRGEGFGLSPFFAGAAGNPIIVTGWGGTTEYAKPDNSYLVDYILEPVYGMPWSPWYRGNQLWAYPNVSRAAELMRHVYNNRDEARARGAKLKEYISNNFTWDNIGDRIISELQVMEDLNG